MQKIKQDIVDKILSRNLLITKSKTHKQIFKGNKSDKKNSKFF